MIFGNHNLNRIPHGSVSTPPTTTSSSQGILHDQPQKIPDPKVTSAMMVKELNSMSIQERETAMEDIHGVSQINEESPEFIFQCLNEIQFALQKIRYKPAYDIALSQSYDYATSRELFLMFLRGADYDPKEAATKMVTYFEHKRLYFGDALLGRQLRYSDLNDFDLEYLKCGYMQVLPFRDKAGRIVIWTNLAYQEKKNVINCMRALFYFSSALLMEEETQKSGCVAVSVTGKTGLDLSQDTQTVHWHLARYSSYSPMKMMATHFCIENAGVVMQLVALAHNTWGQRNRVRHRIHHGSQTEWMYTLMTFGIPVDYAPITTGGQLKTKYHKEWLSQIRILETEHFLTVGTPLSKIVLTGAVLFPCRSDVLFGKGSVVQHYDGNQLFNQIVDCYRERYQNEVSRKKKSLITKEVWTLLLQENIRFLEKTREGYWEVICNEEDIFVKIVYRLRIKNSKSVVRDSSSAAAAAAAGAKKNENKGNNNKMNRNRTRDESTPSPAAMEDDDDDNDNNITFLNQTGDSSTLFTECCNTSGPNKRARR